MQLIDQLITFLTSFPYDNHVYKIEALKLLQTITKSHFKVKIDQFQNMSEKILQFCFNELENEQNEFVLTELFCLTRLTLQIVKLEQE